MPLGLTTEQEELAEATASLLGKYATGAYARATTEDPGRWRELWDALQDMGIPAMLVAASEGGLGFDLPDLVAVMERAGQVVLPAPLLSTVGAFSQAVLASGSSANLTRQLVSGTTGVLVLDEGFGGESGNRISFEQGALSVDCAVVPDIMRAELVAFATSHDQPRLIVARTADLEVRQLPAMDETQPVGQVATRGLSKVEVLGDPTAGILKAFVVASAELVGMATALEASAIEHARVREQFGAPIGSFQAVKHALANVHLNVEAARSLVYRAAATPEDAVVVHQSKAAAADAVLNAARTAVQLHGGMGITREHDVSLMYLRARQSSMALGTRDFHWRRAAEIISRNI